MIMFFFISPRKPLERVRLIIYQCFPYHLGNSSNGSELLCIQPSYIYPHSYPGQLSYYKFIAIYHTPHTSPSQIYPEYVLKYGGGRGTQCLTLFTSFSSHHVWKQGGCGNGISPAYILQAWFPYKHFRTFSVRYKQIDLDDVAQAVRVCPRVTCVLAQDNPQTRRAGYV